MLKEEFLQIFVQLFEYLGTSLFFYEILHTKGDDCIKKHHSYLFFLFYYFMYIKVLKMKAKTNIFLSIFFNFYIKQDLCFRLPGIWELNLQIHFFFVLLFYCL